MKKFTLLFFIICLFTNVRAAKTTVATEQDKAVVENNSLNLSQQQMQMMSGLSVKEIEQLTGKKLSLKEKISWMLLKKQLKKNKRYNDTGNDKQNSHAILGFVFSILGLVIFPFFAIPAYILANNALQAEKQNPGTLSNSNISLAKAARVISLITAILLVAFVAFVIIFFAGLGRWG